MKHISFIVLFFAMVIMAVSCTTDDDAQATGTYRRIKYYDSSMLDKAVTTNDSLKATADLTRGADNWRIVISDLKGAYKGGKWGTRIGGIFGSNGRIFGGVLGGVAYGGFKSWIVYKKKDPKDATLVADYLSLAGCTNNMLTDSMTIAWDRINALADAEPTKGLRLPNAIKDGLTLSTEYLDKGRMHNILLNVESGRLFVSANAPTADAPTTRGSDKSGRVDEEDMAWCRMQVMKMDNQVSLYQGAYDDYDLTSTKADSLINLFCEALEYVSDDNGLVRVANSYTAIVSNTSELNKDEKLCILDAFGVAIYSYCYWKEVYGNLGE